MVLSGIGGSTIAEAKQTVSMNEFNAWLAYRKKRGPLSLTRRFDIGIARFLSVYVNSKVKPSDSCSMYDFMPYEEEPPIDLDNAMKRWE